MEGGLAMIGKYTKICDMKLGEVYIHHQHPEDGALFYGPQIGRAHV